MRYVIGVLTGALALMQGIAVAPAQLAPPAAKTVPAQPEIAADIHEEIAHVEATVRLLNGASHTGNLVITHFRPAGPGPFPVVVFNHGRTPATRHEPVRWRMASSIGGLKSMIYQKFQAAGRHRRPVSAKRRAS